MRNGSLLKDNTANATNPDEYGNYVPDDKKMETLFQRSSVLMGSFEGITEDGIQLNSDWKMNDGLVNTVSAMAPDFAPIAGNLFLLANSVII